jgi:S1-C subfamily serine protease
MQLRFHRELTLLLAVSFGWLLAVQATVKAAILSKDTAPVAISVFADGRPLGRVYRLDDDGYFIGPRIVGAPKKILTGDQKFEFRFVSQDGLSGLSLLRALNPSELPGGSLELPSDRADGMVLRGFSVSGDLTRPVVAEVTGRMRAGVLDGLNRLVPINEIRYEQVANPTTILFFKDSELHGGLVSVLTQTISSQNNAVAADALQSSPANSLGFTNQQFQNYGPAGLTVGYLLGPDIMRRVIEGFRSPARKVIYPFFGVVCRNAISGGAEIVEVTPNSPANLSGLREGDVLVKVGRYAIKNQFDFSAVVWKFRPGEKVAVGYQRQSVRHSGNVVLSGISY